MNYNGKKAENIKVAYIGGGSRGWAWCFMSDLASSGDMSGEVYLYDIDFEAAKANEIIGNKYNDLDGATSKWKYKASNSIDEALKDADFVIMSIQPGTFDEMESDVHHPEKYGIYQPVGDSTGPGGIIRAMRTIPIYEAYALKIKELCPDAWVINLTNPMTLCVKALYNAFPEIKAFGCCHEVFGTQKFLVKIVEEFLGETPHRSEIKVNPIGVNHFTWLTSATYKGHDIFPLFKKMCEKYPDGVDNIDDRSWLNKYFDSAECVKMDLFSKYGYIAAAGDRHLAEFCEGKWYLENPERVEEMRFGLTPVSWRKGNLERLKGRSEDFLNGKDEPKIFDTGEEIVDQMRALLGLADLVTNVNIPNYGQIPNLPLGAILETNAYFTADSVTPVFAGAVPIEIYPLISRIVAEQEMVAQGVKERDLNRIFTAFLNDPLITCGKEDAKKMFDEMIENTKEYLKDFEK